MGHEILKALIEIRNWCRVEGCTEQVQIADKAMIAAGLKDIPCFQCDGLGEWDEGPLPARSSAQISPEYRQVICPECNRSGRLPLTSSPLSLERAAEEVRNYKGGGKLYYGAAGGFSVVPYHNREEPLDASPLTSKDSQT